MKKETVSLKATREEFEMLSSFALRKGMTISSALRFAALEKRFPQKEPSSLTLLTSDECMPSAEAMAFIALLPSYKIKEKRSLSRLKSRIESDVSDLYLSLLKAAPDQEDMPESRAQMTRVLKRITPSENLKEYAFIRAAFSDEELVYMSERAKDAGCGLDSYMRRQLLRVTSQRHDDGDIAEAREAADILKETKLFTKAVLSHSEKYGLQDDDIESVSASLLSTAGRIEKITTDLSGEEVSDVPDWISELLT